MARLSSPGSERGGEAGGGLLPSPRKNGREGMMGRVVSPRAMRVER